MVNLDVSSIPQKSIDIELQQKHGKLERRAEPTYSWIPSLKFTGSSSAWSSEPARVCELSSFPKYSTADSCILNQSRDKHEGEQNRLYESSELPKNLKINIQKILVPKSFKNYYEKKVKTFFFQSYRIHDKMYCKLHGMMTKFYYTTTCEWTSTYKLRNYPPIEHTRCNREMCY